LRRPAACSVRRRARVYKTADAGKTWKQVLKVDDDHGRTIRHGRANNQILYASMYQRRRTACCMNGGAGQRRVEVD